MRCKSFFLLHNCGVSTRARNNFTIEVAAGQRERIQHLALTYDTTQRRMMTRLVDWLLSMPPEVQHMVLSPIPGKRWVPSTDLGDWRALTNPESDDPNLTHRITRILDPELTLPPGQKPSDRDRPRAKRAG